VWYDAADVQIFGFLQEFTYTNGVDLCAGCTVFNKGLDSSEVKAQNPLLIFLVISVMMPAPRL
jgi:hypothetical protein